MSTSCNASTGRFVIRFKQPRLSLVRTNKRRTKLSAVVDWSIIIAEIDHAYENKYSYITFDYKIC